MTSPTRRSAIICMSQERCIVFPNETKTENGIEFVKTYGTTGWKWMPIKDLVVSNVDVTEIGGWIRELEARGYYLDFSQQEDV